jgi:hypothetical protein
MCIPYIEYRPPASGSGKFNVVLMCIMLCSSAGKVGAYVVMTGGQKTGRTSNRE